MNQQYLAMSSIPETIPYIAAGAKMLMGCVHDSARNDIIEMFRECGPFLHLNKGRSMLICPKAGFVHFVVTKDEKAAAYLVRGMEYHLGAGYLTDEMKSRVRIDVAPIIKGMQNVN